MHMYAHIYVNIDPYTCVHNQRYIRISKYGQNVVVQVPTHGNFVYIHVNNTSCESCAQNSGG